MRLAACLLGGLLPVVSADYQKLMKELEKVVAESQEATKSALKQLNNRQCLLRNTEKEAKKTAEENTRLINEKKTDMANVESMPQTDEAATFAAQISALQLEIAAHKSEKNKKEAEYNAVDADLIEAAKSLKAALKAIEKPTTFLTKSINPVKSLLSEKLSANDRHLVLSKIEKTQKETEAPQKHQSSVGGLKTLIENLVAEYEKQATDAAETWTKTKDALEELIKAGETKLKQLEGEQGAEARETAEKEKRLAELKEEIGLLESEMEEDKAAIGEMKADVEMANKKYDAAQKETTDLAKGVNEAIAALKKIRAKLANRSTLLTQLEATDKVVDGDDGVDVNTETNISDAKQNAEDNKAARGKLYGQAMKVLADQDTSIVKEMEDITTFKVTCEKDAMNMLRNIAENALSAEGHATSRISNEDMEQDKSAEIEQITEKIKNVMQDLKDLLKAYKAEEKAQDEEIAELKEISAGLQSALDALDSIQDEKTKIIVQRVAVVILEGMQKENETQMTLATQDKEAARKRYEKEKKDRENKQTNLESEKTDAEAEKATATTSKVDDKEAYQEDFGNMDKEIENYNKNRVSCDVALVEYDGKIADMNAALDTIKEAEAHMSAMMA